MATKSKHLSVFIVFRSFGVEVLVIELLSRIELKNHNINSRRYY